MSTGAPEPVWLARLSLLLLALPVVALVWQVLDRPAPARLPAPAVMPAALRAAAPPPESIDWAAFTSERRRREQLLQFVHAPLEHHNAAIIADRRRLERLRTRQPLTPTELDWLAGLASRYGLPPQDWQSQGSFRRLAARVDVVPPSLPLAHAALVTRWGHHEQMLALHNLFRRLCHTPDCGALPPTRPAGRHYRWQRFGSAAEAVAGELHRYNTHPAYLAFRQARAERRRARQPLAGLALLAALPPHAFDPHPTAEIESVIRTRQLNHLDAIASCRTHHWPGCPEALTAP
ncbi:MAG TPA: hypothetical protein QF361_00965 [Gammaproteobacteria bacterium]|nr:hypothetical protein [Gammaproteobacteria bacterium]